MTLALSKGLAIETMPKARPAWWTSWRRFSRNIPAMLGLTFVIVFVLVGLFAQWLAPYDPTRGRLDDSLLAPSFQHWFGTDELGRDMLSRLIFGTRSALFVTLIVTTFNLVLGLPLGALAGYFGGWIDNLLMRASEIVFAFPGLLFVFFVAATVRPAILNWLRANGLADFAKSGYADYAVVLVALSIIGWAGLARLVRGQVLSLRERDFVMSARAVGVSSWRIITRYLIPNAMTPIIVSISMGAAGIALSEGTLSYLGIGLQPPNPSWGNIIADNIGRHWRDWPGVIWLVWAPGVMLAILVFAFNFLGDGLNEALNPELY